MSEPSSLYMRVNLTKNQLEAFKNSPLVAPSHYQDWRSWLNTKKFYGQITDAEIQAMNPATSLARSEMRTVGDYVARLLQDAYVGPSQAQYDAPSNTWTLCVMQLSENFKAFILILSILRGIAAYKDLPGEDFILIYPYLWEETPEAHANAYVTITPGSSRLIHEIPGEAINEANQRLGQVMDEFRKSYNDDDL